MTNKSAPTQRQRRARYTPAQQFTNNFAARVCGIKPSEQDWIAADLANSQAKTERHDDQALKDQIKYFDTVGEI